MGYFLPYQERWINDNSPIKLYEKSRRIGITYATSFRCVMKCLNEPQNSSFVQWVSSRDELTAKEFITDYIAMWAREANSISRELAAACNGAAGLDGREVEVVDEKHGITAYVVRFNNGSRIYSLSSNPLVFAGKGGDILLDELDLHKDQKTLYAMAYPCITWGYQLEMVSAYDPDGSENTTFAQLCRDAAQGQKSGVSLHRTTLDDAIREGFVEKVNAAKAKRGRPTQTREEFRAQIRSGCLTQGAFDSQYMCIPNRASGQQVIAPLDLLAAQHQYDITYLKLHGNGTVLDVVDPVVLPYCEVAYWRDQTQLHNWGQLALGWDAATSEDLGCIFINEKQGDNNYKLVACLIFKKCKIQSQVEIITAILNANLNAVCCGDASGLGLSDCAKLESRFYERFCGVNFNVKSKLAMYTTLQGVYESHRQQLPINQPEIIADIKAMRKGTGAGDRLLFVATPNELLKESHCDIMSAHALAVWAGETIPIYGEFHAEPAGEYQDDLATSYAKSRYPDHSDDY